MVEFRVLGSLELRRSNGQAIPEILSHPKLVAVLAYLAAAQPSGFHRRDKLLALFWPEQDEPHARHALNQSLYALRQALGDPVVISRGPEEVGLDWSDLHCDVAAFRDALAAGRPEAAMEQYRGELLDGFHVSGVPEFERWLDRERAALRDLALQAARGLSQRDDVEGPASALRWAWEACALAPYDEAAFRRLAELLDRSGDRARVLKEYEALVARLAQDLEAEPSPETQALIAGIRRRERVHEAPAKEREASKAGTAADATDAEAVVDAGAAGTVVDAGGVEAVVDAGGVEAAVDAGATGAAVDAGATAPGDSERTALGAASKQRTGRRHLALKLGGSLVLALLVVGLWLRVSGYPLPLLGGPRSLVAAGFLEPRDTVILADVDPANADTVLAEAITEALRIDLSRSRMVTLLGPGRLADALARMERPTGERLTAELARELAIRESLKAVIDGRITAVGASYVITARVVEPESGEILAAFRETADDSTGVLRALDRLSVALRARLGESLRSVRRGQSLSRVTTASLPALRKYTMALRASSEFDQDRAIGLLEEAIALDTAFAMAYRKLGVALLSRGIQTPRARWALEQALAHQDRLSDVERYLVLGTYHGLVGDDAEAIAAYRNLLRLRPGDATALNNLGAVYLSAGDYARAESAYLAATAPGHVPLAYLGAATAQVEQGELDDAAATVRRMLEVFPGNVAGLDYVARLAALRGDFAASDSVYATMEGAPGWRVSTYFYRGMNAGTQGRITEAKRWVDRALGEIRYPNYRVWNRTLRAYFDLEVLGRVEPAVRTVDDVVAITPSDAFTQEPGIYITLSVFYALAGDPARARELLAGLHAVVDTMPDADPSSAVDAANGFIALAENRPPAAIRWFREAQAHGPQPGRFQAFLGRAFELDHQPDSAIAAYTRYVEAPWLGRDGHDFLLPTDPYMLAQVHERLAQLLDARGDERAAIRHYARFVELWQAADPELQPRVEAARRRLDELRRALAPGG